MRNAPPEDLQTNSHVSVPRDVSFRAWLALLPLAEMLAWREWPLKWDSNRHFITSTICRSWNKQNLRRADTNLAFNSEVALRYGYDLFRFHVLVT